MLIKAVGKTTLLIHQCSPELFGNSQHQVDREQGLQGMRHETTEGWEGARSGKFWNMNIFPGRAALG